MYIFEPKYALMIYDEEPNNKRAVVVCAISAYHH